MSKASRIVVLCEDKLQAVVVRRFLTKGWGHGPRTVRVIPPPAGREGSGEKYVRDQYPVQLKECRGRHASTILIVVIDADRESVKKHHDELSQACQQTDNGPAPRTDDEPVVHVIPKRNMETWLAYLDGVSVDETTDYKKGKYLYRGNESACHGLVDVLAARCKNRENLVSPPESLADVCKEFDRIRDRL